MAYYMTVIMGNLLGVFALVVGLGCYFCIKSCNKDFDKEASYFISGTLSITMSFVLFAITHFVTRF